MNEIGVKVAEKNAFFKNKGWTLVRKLTQSKAFFYGDGL